MLFRGFVMMGLMVLALPAMSADRDALNAYLAEGRVQEGLEEFASPSDNAERFSLAVLQALDGVERFSGGINNLGLNPRFVMGGLPLLGVVPDLRMDAAGPVTTGQVAELFRSFRSSLRKANATLAEIDDEEFDVVIDLARARLDFDGDGTATTEETLLRSFERVPNPQEPSTPQEDLTIRFDSADAKWLQGYTHFLGGILDILTAYDWRPVWNQCAHIVFQEPDPRPEIAVWSGAADEFGDFPDMIAAVHDMRLELIEEDAWHRAREEFRGMIACSRACWARVDEETDDDREWLPSPRQTGPRGAVITQEEINGWLRVLDELGAVAAGEKLLPHWRLKPGSGINIDKLVAAPPELDLVLLIQGSAFLPYLEEGPVSDAEAWDELTAPFGPGFARFAVWSN